MKYLNLNDKNYAAISSGCFNDPSDIYRASYRETHKRFAAYASQYLGFRVLINKKQ